MADVLPFLDRQTRARALITARVETYLSRAWRGLGSWNRADVDRFVDLVAPMIEAAQIQVASLTDVYLSSVLSELSGREVATLGVAAGEVTGLRPLPIEDVYRRPFVDHWTALGRGVSFDAALSAGAARLLRLAADDISMAHRRTSLTVISQADNVTGFRRVIRPELAAGGTCGLCIAAADQVYSKDRLLPIHTRCHCEVMPIVRRSSGDLVDPAKGLNDEDISETYKRVSLEAKSSSAADLKRVRVMEVEHGELGPILREQGQAFTSASDI